MELVLAGCDHQHDEVILLYVPLSCDISLLFFPFLLFPILLFPILLFPILLFPILLFSISISIFFIFNLLLLLIFWLKDLGVLFVRLRTDRTSFLQLLVPSFYLLIIVEVVGYQFIGYDKSRPKVPLQSSKNKHNRADPDKNDQHPHIVGLSGQRLQIVPIVDKGQSRKNNREDKCKSHASLASQRIRVVDLHRK